jgi:hypothetical protein
MAETLYFLVDVVVDFGIALEVFRVGSLGVSHGLRPTTRVLGIYNCFWGLLATCESLKAPHKS